jgi:type VI secretion system protein VasD
MKPIGWHNPCMVACVILALLLNACAGKEKPSVLEANLQVQSDINPDVSGRPSPVIVRLYELKSLATFDSLNFFSLFEHGKESLGADLVAADELQLMPDEKRKFERILQTDTRFVGVVAGFRDMEHASWRAATGVRANKVSRVTIQLDGNRIQIITE